MGLVEGEHVLGAVHDGAAEPALLRVRRDERNAGAIVEAGAHMELGPQSKSDNKMTARYRLHQSRYRAEVLREPCGRGPTKNSTRHLGNMLVDGHLSGSNFLSPAALDLARAKVAEKQGNKFLTIDEYRLFNNMLSSMPMCFNLFADLGAVHTQAPEQASALVARLFEEIPWIHALDSMNVEFIPVPIANYTNDKSAFDAVLFVRDQTGRTGLVSIETKYTDVLGRNVAKDSATKNALVSKGGFFREPLVASLQQHGYRQIHRNFLLTYAYAERHGFAHFANVVISPSDDDYSQPEIDDLRSGMLRFQDRVLKIPLETLVARGVGLGHDVFSRAMVDFQRRYIPPAG